MNNVIQVVLRSAMHVIRHLTENRPAESDDSASKPSVGHEADVLSTAVDIVRDQADELSDSEVQVSPCNYVPLGASKLATDQSCHLPLLIKDAKFECTTIADEKGDDLEDCASGSMVGEEVDPTDTFTMDEKIQLLDFTAKVFLMNFPHYHAHKAVLPIQVKYLFFLLFIYICLFL